MMRLVLNLIAALLALTGVIWILQGINILPGSFMTGQSQWAIAGTGVLIVALLLFYAANRILK